MALDLWTHQFCLACDKQVSSDGQVYCSEACRLADLEITSTSSSPSSSPSCLAPTRRLPWSTTSSPLLTPIRHNNIYLTPPLDLDKPQLRYQGDYRGHSTTAAWPLAPGLSHFSTGLTPSSSHNSLCSMHSTSSSSCSSTDAAHLSDKSKRQLKMYAMSFEQATLQRRRSC